MNRPSRPGDGGTDRDLLASARDRLPPEVDVVELAGPPAGDGDVVNPPSHEDIRSVATQSKAAVVEVSNGVMAEMSSLGRLFGPAEGMWRSCRDKAGWLQYFVGGRVDPNPDARRDDVLVKQVTSSLEPKGYRLEQVDDNGEVVTLEAVTGEVNIQLTCYTDDPFVLFDISGRCVEVADLDGEFRYQPPEALR
ncbi:MAG: hypothetical protein ABJA93_09330 [Sporichthyaceae bacterium]